MIYDGDHIDGYDVDCRDNDDRRCTLFHLQVNGALHRARNRLKERDETIRRIRFILSEHPTPSTI